MVAGRFSGCVWLRKLRLQPGVLRVQEFGCERVQRFRLEVLDRANPERAIEDSISHVFLAYDWPSLSN